MRLLALDSSAKSASVAIIEDEKLLGEFYVNVGLTHSETLAPMVKSVLDKTGVEVGSIDCFAATVGPGSFTGIRIGVSTVKGIAMALNKPCVAVSTLEAIAYNMTGKNCIISAVMDARRNQVYNANFVSDGARLTRLTEDRAISIDDLFLDLQKHNKSVVFVGDGADLCYNGGKAESIYSLASPAFKYQTARCVAYVARQHFLSGLAKPVSELIPVYLRPSQAERIMCAKKETTNE